MLRNISLTIPMETLKTIDDNRGDIPRSRYILKLLNFALVDSKNYKSNKKIPVDQSLDAKDQLISIVKGVN